MTYIDNPLIADLISALEAAGDEVTIDLTEDPPTVIARTGGMVFAAAWPADDGVFLRLRLDVSHVPSEHLDPSLTGALAYESILRTPADVSELRTLLAEAHQTAARARAAN